MFSMVSEMTPKVMGMDTAMEIRSQNRYFDNGPRTEENNGYHLV